MAIVLPADNNRVVRNNKKRLVCTRHCFVVQGFVNVAAAAMLMVQKLCKELESRDNYS